MADEVQIRPARRTDLADVHRLEVECFPAPWRQEFFAGELNASGRFCLVACQGSEVIGYVFAMWVFEEMHVNKIAVRPADRRSGVADALMAECLDFARQHDVETISLEVRKSNLGAQEFYRALSFETSYVRPRYYPDGEAAVVMIKKV